MKIFITGVNGQLGHDVLNEAARRGYDVVGSDISAAPIPDAFQNCISEFLDKLY